MKLSGIILLAISYTLSCDIIFVKSSALAKSHDNLVEICKQSRYSALTSKHCTYYYYHDEQMKDEDDQPGKYYCIGINSIGNSFLCSEENGKNCNKLYIGKAYPQGTIEYIQFDPDPKKRKTVCSGFLEERCILYVNSYNFHDSSTEVFHNGNILFDLKTK